MDHKRDAIENLEINIRWIQDIPEHQFPGWKNVVLAMRDAAEELKTKDDNTAEAEIEGGGMSWFFVCGECHTAIDTKDKYCRCCGRKIIWT